MSRPDAIHVKGLSDTEKAPTQEEISEYLSQQISVLDRHSISARFHVPNAPGDIHYEWHNDNPDTHHRLVSKGFVTDDELAKTSMFVHTDGAGNPRIGDTRLYKIPKWKYEALQAIETEKVREKQDPRRANEDLHTRLLESGLAVAPKEHSGNAAEVIDSDKLANILTEITSRKE
jgi:hypothetical protein